MDNDQTEFTWITQKMYVYQDPDTASTLNVLMDSGIIESENGNNYHAPRIIFQIRDGKVVSNSKVQIELQFAELCGLMGYFESVIAAQFNIEKISNYAITRFVYNNKKDIVFSFLKVANGSISLQIEINDPTKGTDSRKVIFLDTFTFRCLIRFCGQVRDSYASLSISFLSALIQQKVLEEIRGLQIPKPTFTSVSKDDVDISMDEQYGSSPSKNVESPMEYFMEKSYAIFDEIKLDGVPTSTETKVAPEKTKQPYVEKVPMPFIGTFLDYDPNKLIEWVTSFLNADEKTVSSSFCPISHIIASVASNKKLSENATLLKVQYFLNVMFRKSVREYLSGTKSSVYPIFKLPENNSIKVNSELRPVSEEILFLFILYTNLYSNYVKYLGADKEKRNSVIEIYLVYRFMRYYLSFFAVSMDRSDVLTMKSNLLIILDKCDKNGFTSKLQDFYTKLTSGGKLDLSPQMMDKYFDSFLDSVGKLSTFGPSELESVSGENGINLSGQISSFEEVKICTLAALKTEDKKPSDSRLVLFLNCIRRSADPVLIKQIESSCKKFDDVINVFRQYNVPEDIMRVKRVMDRDPGLMHKSDVMNAVKELKEESSVTETRVLFDANIKNPINQTVGVEGIVTEQLEGEF